MKKIVVKAGVLSSMFLVGSNVNYSLAMNPDPVFLIQTDPDSKTESFKVYGNCGMCKKTIEGSLKNVKGVNQRNWNQKTKMMEVTYDPTLTTLTEIKQKIASAGYDTDEVRAKDKTYNRLPMCCQYDRPE